MHARTLIPLAIALAIAATAARAQDALTLLRTARVEPGRPVLLGDVARLDGPSAERLASLVLIQSPEAEPADAAGWFHLGLDRVREVLEAELGEGAGMVAITGSACDIRAVRPPQERPAVPDRNAKAPDAPDATPLVGLHTVRGALAREIARVLQASPDALRLTFDPEDGPFLDQAAAGRPIEISAIGASDPLPMAVTLYGPNGRADRHTVRVGVRVRRPVSIVSRVLPRGDPIGPGDVAAEQRWVSPTDRVVPPESAAGSVAKRRLDPGELIETHMIEPPVMVHRGDMVIVRVFCAGLIVRRESNALADGREGEVIEFAARGNPRQRYRATVVGKGQATIGAPVPTGTQLASDTDAG